MAVPSSGSITMYGLAREKHHDDYSTNQNILIPISMYDLVKGGDTNGSGVSYDVTTQASSSKPNTSAPHSMSEWYGYDHDAISGTIYESSWSPSGTNYYTNGTDDIGHATKSAACASTNTINSCVAVTWTGTLANGTVLYHHYGNSCVQNTVLDANDRYIKMGDYGGGIGSNCGTDYPGGTAGFVMKVSDSGVVSEFATSCVTLTSYSSSGSTGKGVFACALLLSNTYYHDGNYTYPVVGDICYSDNAGNNTLGSGHYKVSAVLRIQLNSLGVVTSTNLCDIE